MSEADDAQKTEDPSQQKLDEAREKGQVVKSMEVSHWFILLSALLIFGVFGREIGAGLKEAVFVFLERPHEFPLDAAGSGRAILDALTAILFVLLVPLCIMLVAAIAPSLGQTGILFATDQLMPKLERVSPLAGLKRIFSVKGLFETLKGLVKITIVGILIVWLVWPEVGRVGVLIELEMGDLLHETWITVLKMLAAALAVMTVVATGDYLYQRYEFMRQMRMTKQEVKDEFKQSEGDPTVKARLRQIRMDRARRRMMAAVPKATVVVTNPTHYAVALHYRAQDMSAPKLVAKGVDLIAQKIREVAGEAGVPIVENPPVARALYAAVDIDEEIPPEQYKAVAEIISFVMKSRKTTVDLGRRP
ncbi:MAG: flagellar biosynthesis protein FlhB [Thalassobaculales bacterium]